MLANVRNNLNGEDMHLRLVRLGNRVVWEDIETGALHGQLYSSIRAAAIGLQRSHAEAGTQVLFKTEQGDYGVEVVAA